jgi:hypothetical protein
LWIDTTTVHLSIDGQHLTTLPSRLTSIDLARLRAQGARPAGPPPARPSWAQLAAGAPVEIQRTVNATGTVSIAGKHHCIGQHFAGRRITLRLETTLLHVVLNGVLTRTIPLSLTPTQRARLQGARAPGPAPIFDERPARCSAPCPVAGAPKSSANASKSDYVMPVRSSPSKSTRPPCGSTTTANI